MSSSIKELTTFGKLGRIWNHSANAGFFDIPVHDYQWEAVINNAVSALEENPGRSNLEYLLRLLIFRIGNSPLPAFQQNFWPEGRKDIFIEHVKDANRATPSPALENLIAQLDTLVVERIQHPMWEAVKQLAPGLPSDLAFMLGRRRLQRESGSLIRSMFPGAMILTPVEFKNLNQVDALIVFGVPSNYDDWLRAIAMVPTYWIHLDRHRAPVVRDEFLGDGVGVKFRPAIATTQIHIQSVGAREAPEVDPHSSEFSPVDWRELTIRTSSSIEGDGGVSDRDEMLECTGFELGEGLIVLIPDGSTSTVFVPEDHLIRNLHRHEISKGMFVVIRVNEGRDYLRELIESKFLVDAAHVGAELRRWKHALRVEINRLGIHEVARRLRKLGVEEKPQTIRTWSTETVYGPGNKSSFFALMNLLDIQNNEDQWRYVEAYRAAGHQAGHYVRAQLRDQIEGLHPARIERAEKLTFKLEEVKGQSLIAHRIEDIQARPINAPARLTNQILRVGDDSWHG